MNKSIFITGGAGYVGTSLIPQLLNEGFNVTVYDSLFFNNGDTLIPYVTNPNFNFIYGDIRDEKKISESLKGKDIVIHLAAYVGYPLCVKMGESESYSVNVEGTEILMRYMAPEQYLIYSSTGSNYGNVEEICTEETPLNPLSTYGRTKTLAEHLVMNRDNTTAFRFATAFGISPRMRLDLLINDLTYKCILDGYAVVYESHFMRTFIHVRDMGKSFITAINNQDKFKNNIFNVGSDKMNFSKKDVCELIKEYVPKTYISYADIGEDADRRNYVVCYDKINQLGYSTTISIEDGLKELIKTIPLLKITSNYRNI
jgi:nucleoside-diphosphate-sugar epimerase